MKLKSAKFINSINYQSPNTNIQKTSLTSDEVSLSLDTIQGQVFVVIGEDMLVPLTNVAAMIREPVAQGKPKKVA